MLKQVIAVLLMFCIMLTPAYSMSTHTLAAPVKSFMRNHQHLVEHYIEKLSQARSTQSLSGRLTTIKSLITSAVHEIQQLTVVSNDKRTIQRAPKVLLPRNVIPQGQDHNPIDDTFLRFVKQNLDTYNAELGGHHDELEVKAAVFFASLRDLLKDGWHITRKNTDSYVRRILEKMGEHTFTRIDRNNLPRFAKAILTIYDSGNNKKQLHQAVTDNLAKIMYLEQLETGNLGSPTDAFLRKLTRVIPLLFLSGVATIFASFGMQSLQVSQSVYLVVRSFGFVLSLVPIIMYAQQVRLDKVSDIRVRQHALQRLQGLTLSADDHYDLLLRLIDFYEGKTLAQYGEPFFLNFDLLFGVKRTPKKPRYGPVRSIQDAALGFAASSVRTRREAVAVFRRVQTMLANDSTDFRRPIVVEKILPMTQYIVTLPHDDILREQYSAFLKQEITYFKTHKENMGFYQWIDIDHIPDVLLALSLSHLTSPRTPLTKNEGATEKKWIEASRITELLATLAHNPDDASVTDLAALFDHIQGESFHRYFPLPMRQLRRWKNALSELQKSTFVKKNAHHREVITSLQRTIKALLDVDHILRVHYPADFTGRYTKKKLSDTEVASFIQPTFRNTLRYTDNLIREITPDVFSTPPLYQDVQDAERRSVQLIDEACILWLHFRNIHTVLTYASHSIEHAEDYQVLITLLSSKLSPLRTVYGSSLISLYDFFTTTQDQSVETQILRLAEQISGARLLPEQIQTHIGAFATTYHALIELQTVPKQAQIEGELPIAGHVLSELRREKIRIESVVLNAA